MILLAFWFACAIAGALIAPSRNVPSLEGAAWGIFLGPLGVLVVACMKPREPGTPVVRRGLLLTLGVLLALLIVPNVIAGTVGW